MWTFFLRDRILHIDKQMNQMSDNNVLLDIAIFQHDFLAFVPVAYLAIPFEEIERDAGNGLQSE